MQGGRAGDPILREDQLLAKAHRLRKKKARQGGRAAGRQGGGRAVPRRAGRGTQGGVPVAPASLCPCCACGLLAHRAGCAGCLPLSSILSFPADTLLRACRPTNLQEKQAELDPFAPEFGQGDAWFQVGRLPAFSLVSCYVIAVVGSVRGHHSGARQGARRPSADPGGPSPPAVSRAGRSAAQLEQGRGCAACRVEKQPQRAQARRAAAQVVRVRVEFVNSWQSNCGCGQARHRWPPGRPWPHRVWKEKTYSIRALLELPVPFLCLAHLVNALHWA